MTVALTLPCFSPSVLFTVVLAVAAPSSTLPRHAAGPGDGGPVCWALPLPESKWPWGSAGRQPPRGSRAPLPPCCSEPAEKAQPQQISPGQRPLSCLVPGLRGPVPSGVAFPTAATVDAPLVDFEIQFLPSPGRASSTVSPRCREIIRETHLRADGEPTPTSQNGERRRGAGAGTRKLELASPSLQGWGGAPSVPRVRCARTVCRGRH